ncbi:6-phosphogluconate dehydrogenase C-terminal domain-like protein [Aulographum hederae CBS 113979]|uniref:6-phosphogluconate dehydrogenase, decarboxylating n=1 Tax=Aulographum hederae CBS 113979 TaxID=1176131 RepID=A0A6G1HBI4_9PEZI|nr:6-phosphogluconate dehydrogenase C-terminal domain-like protein [Aulographum hederae CBS 113979]
MGPPTIKKLAMIGCGSMGGGMALLFAENGLEVSLQDPSKEAMDALKKSAEKQGLGEKTEEYTDYQSLCASLDSPKLIVFSLPHGDVGDTVLGGLLPYLEKDDIILDCGNERWTNTERRQSKCVTRGIEYIGCGVSGGYQAARAGPSMCPGGSDEGLDTVLPLLKKVAAKDKEGKSCVGKVGTGGCGHYVKMVHNGIEHGMMSAISEAWKILVTGAGLPLEEVGDIFENWDQSGHLSGTFLVSIGASISRTIDPSTGERVVLTVEDKVVQDITGEEGTGIWSNVEAIEHHIPAPTMATAHFLRLASADRQQRVDAQKAFGGEISQQKIDFKSSEDKSEFVESLRVAVFAACLASYIQGINVIERADKENGWNVDFAAVHQIWKAGCIIQSDYISELLSPIFTLSLEEVSSTSTSKAHTRNLLLQPHIMSLLREAYPHLRRIVAKATEKDWCVPALSATLEYIKYQTGTDLPTGFYEAELDFFGKHMFDRKGAEGSNELRTGAEHFEWKPAMGS